MKKYKLAILLTLLIILMPQITVFADTGPKAEMTFTFQQKEGEPTNPKIETGTLYECNMSDCSDAAPLEEMGPQRFECAAYSCYSMAYGYADYFQLEIAFEDGVTRKSNIFTKNAFDAGYMVAINASSLSVG